MTIPAPAPDEFASFYAGYVALAEGRDLPAELQTQLDEVLEALRPLPEEKGRFRYAEGKWSIQEVVGHLCDAERVFAYRLLRIGRGDATPLPGYDEDEFVAAANFDARTLKDLMMEFAALRRATVLLAEGLPSAAWANRGLANDQVVSARALAHILFGHTAHHLGVLRERYGL
jgi:uncharacterized damage-inducible protein DinB